MKKGTKKIIASSENFNNLQILMNGFYGQFDVQAPRWGGFWDGMNWSQLSFFCTPETLKSIKKFCKIPDYVRLEGLQITFK